MPIFDFTCRHHNTRFRVLDATGRQILYVKSCNTESGEVVRYEMTANGTWKLGPSGKVPTVKEKHPAPLRVWALLPEEPYVLERA